MPWPAACPFPWFVHQPWAGNRPWGRVGSMWVADLVGRDLFVTGIIWLLSCLLLGGQHRYQKLRTLAAHGRLGEGDVVVLDLAQTHLHQHVHQLLKGVHVQLAHERQVEGGLGTLLHFDQGGEDGGESDDRVHLVSPLICSREYRRLNQPVLNLVVDDDRDLRQLGREGHTHEPLHIGTTELAQIGRGTPLDRIGAHVVDAIVLEVGHSHAQDAGLDGGLDDGHGGFSTN